MLLIVGIFYSGWNANAVNKHSLVRMVEKPERFARYQFPDILLKSSPVGL
jgi:hypothetical protein